MQSETVEPFRTRLIVWAAQAQLAINHPNEALSSALMAYDLCVNSTAQTSNAATISALVLKCKKTKWEGRERDRIRRRGELLGELEEKLEESKKKELFDIDEMVANGEMGTVEAEEERESMNETYTKKVTDLKTAFAVSDPKHMAKREVPDYLVDPITFEIMHDRKSVSSLELRSWVSGTDLEHWPSMGETQLLFINILIRFSCCHEAWSFL